MSKRSSAELIGRWRRVVFVDEAGTPLYVVYGAPRILGRGDGDDQGHTTVVRVGARLRRVASTVT